MESFKKIQNYYARFDEWSRLDSPSGMLEMMEVIRLVKAYVPKSAHILDLGSGPGRYAIELAQLGYQLSLADLSDRLIQIARERCEELDLTSSIKGFFVANATDLSAMKTASYDAVLCCGPFYHLVQEEDRIAAAKEAMRVCKPDGVLMIGFIPRFSGLAGLLSRAVRSPKQVPDTVFRQAAEEGIFHNASSEGFQEGYYPLVAETTSFWSEMGLTQVEVISTRTFLHQQEPQMMSLLESDPELFETILEASRSYARSEAFIEAGGHAILVGKKRT